MIKCMWHGPLPFKQHCNENATILIVAKCKNGCWSNKHVFACEPHSLIAKNTNDPTNLCGRCKQNSIAIERMTSV